MDGAPGPQNRVPVGIDRGYEELLRIGPPESLSPRTSPRNVPCHRYDDDAIGHSTKSNVGGIRSPDRDPRRQRSVCSRKLVGTGGESSCSTSCKHRMWRSSQRSRLFRKSTDKSQARESRWSTTSQFAPSVQSGDEGVRPITSLGTLVGPLICSVIACVDAETYAGFP